MQKGWAETPLRSPTQISSRIDERGSKWRGTEVRIDSIKGCERGMAKIWANLLLKGFCLAEACKNWSVLTNWSTNNTLNIKRKFQWLFTVWTSMRLPTLYRLPRPSNKTYHSADKILVRSHPIQFWRSWVIGTPMALEGLWATGKHTASRVPAVTTKREQAYLRSSVRVFSIWSQIPRPCKKSCLM